MFVYTEHEQYTWNTVEVFVDGLLQLGKVINVAENGLIIDFGCTGLHSEFVEYGRVFHSGVLWTWWAAMDRLVRGLKGIDLDVNKDPTVQVLLRAGPDCPWIWYPGRAWSLGKEPPFANAFIVEAQLPYGAVKVLLPTEQVRRPPTDAELSRHRAHFVIRSCPLPPCATGLPVPFEILTATLFQEREVLCIKVLNETLQYLQLGFHTALQPDKLSEVYARLKLQRNLNGGISAHLFVRTAAMRLDPKCTESVSCELPFLPILLVEVLQSLDSINRTRCLRVCALWNGILTTDASFRDVWVSGRREESLSPGMSPLFWAVTCLLHCVNRQTKIVVLMHMELSDCDAAATMVRYIIGSGNRVGTLLFGRCSLEHHDNWRITETLKCLARICGIAERVCWTRCRVKESRLTAVVPRYSIICQTDQQLEMQLWDLFEKNLVEQPVRLALLSQWMAQAVAEERYYALGPSLCHYQSVDPRSSTHYRGCQWTASDLRNMDTNKLTKITAAVLCRRLEVEPWLSPPADN
ncbi:uncharacterized protein LOC129599075 [Paramacrobiotus metropolitanus]|uniref:uncharacterized protein LOC129599075 n=1 Tax=Paramacrobiotus metropolitanus TaxID=2943436 RepID=UPI00244624B9|nr:uncharacterized protein LOC129599075 [Paramacrobiotus metropolitanus]